MSLISNSNYSFLCMGKQFAFVYKSCIMQPCYNHLLSSVLWVFHRQSYHLQTKSFISSFPVCMTLTSFPCLAALGITSSKIMKRNCEGEHPSLVLGLRGKASSFFFFFLTSKHNLAVGFRQMFFIKLSKFYSVPSLLSCNEGVLDIVKCFFCIY